MKKYSKNLLIDTMFLEVRDGETWTEEKIQHYLAWLKVFAEWTIKEEFKNDYLESLMQILRISDNPLGCSYVPFFQNLQHNEASCSLTQSLAVRLGDLVIVPCHRLCYDKHIYGKYLVNDNKIVGVKGENINLMYSNLLLGSSGYLKCDTCPFARYCIKQCQGACFEYSKEPLYPIPDVCDLEICKIIFTLNLILDLKNKINQEQYGGKLKFMVDKIEQFLNEIKNNRQEYNKWIQLTENYRLKF